MTTTSSTGGIGTLTQSGSAFRLSGASSALDTEAMVEALSAAKRLPAARLEKRIEANDAKLAAYADLKAKLTALKDSLAGLRNPPGFLGVNSNLFAQKDVFYRSDSTTPPNSLIAVSAGNATAAGSFELQVVQLATARKAMSGTLADASAALSGQVVPDGDFSGSISLGLADRSPVAIAVTGTMSLQDLRVAINAQTSQSGVSASILKEAEGAWRLVLTGAETGKEIMLGQSGDDVMGRLGISSDGGGTFAQVLQAPQQAQLRIDGVLVSRSSNKVTDAVDGMTFDLLRAEPGTTVTVDVEASLATVKEQIVTFVAAYNDLRSFAEAQTALGSDGAVADEAVLFGDATLRALTQGIGGLLSGAVAGLAPGRAGSLAALGITLGADNLLAIDDGKLDRALLTDLEGVRDIFEFRSSSSSANLAVFARPERLAGNAFEVTIVDADDDGVPESATIDGVAMTIQGKRLIGPPGSAYQGLELLWSGKGGESVQMTATQGIADKLFAHLDKALDQTQGALGRAEQGLNDASARYGKEITRIDERVAAHREQLIERFARMEAAMSLAQAMLSQVRAQLGLSESDK